MKIQKNLKVILVLVFCLLMAAPTVTLATPAETATEVALKGAKYFIDTAVPDPASGGVKWPMTNVPETIYPVDIAWGQVGPATFLLEAYEVTGDPQYLNYAKKSADYIYSVRREENGGYWWYHEGGWKLSPDVARTGDFFLKLYKACLAAEDTDAAQYLDTAKKAGVWLASKASNSEGGWMVPYSLSGGAHGVNPPREALTMNFFLHLYQTIGDEPIGGHTVSEYAKGLITWLVNGPDRIDLGDGKYVWKIGRPYTTYSPHPMQENSWLAMAFYDYYDEFKDSDPAIAATCLQQAKGIVKYICTDRITVDATTAKWLEYWDGVQTVYKTTPFEGRYLRIAEDANDLLLRAQQYWVSGDPSYLDIAKKYANWLVQEKIADGNGYKFGVNSGDTNYFFNQDAAIYNYLQNLMQYVGDVNLLTSYKDLADGILTWIIEHSQEINGGYRWSDGYTHGVYSWGGEAGAGYFLLTSKQTQVSEGSCVGYWSFDEGAGNITHDLSGYGNDGTIYSATWTEGKIGKALQFNGVNSWVQILSDPTISGLSQITIEAWIQEDVLPTRVKGIVSKCTGIAHPTYNAEYYLGLYGTDLAFCVSNYNYIAHDTVPNGIDEAGRWYHVAATWSGDSYAIYIDGAPRTSGTCSPQAMFSNTIDLQIGRHGTYSWTYFQGVIDEVKIYNYARSADEIREAAGVQLYVPPVANVDGPYMADEGTPILFDASASSCSEGYELIYRWDFDNDGVYDTDWTTEPTIEHIYMDQYSGLVVLDVSDGESSDDSSAEVNVLDLGPTAGFTWMPEPQAEGTSVLFTDESTSYPDTIVSWSWDFTGLGTSTEQNPTFTFMDNGVYTVTLTVTDDDGSTNSVSHEVIILDLGPMAEFSWTPEPQDEGSPVQFTGLSTSYPDDIVSWRWDFAGLDTSTEQNPTYTFMDDGIYTVTLTVTDDDGSTSIVGYDVTILDLEPNTEFTWSPEPQSEGSLVQFTDQSISYPDIIVTWTWDFGGLRTSSEQNPEFTFMDDGVYIVILTVSDDDGSTSTASHEVTITDHAPVAEFTWSPEPQDEGSPVQFTDASTSYPDELVGWLWSFGDGDSLSEQNPEHIYGDVDVYTATLTVTDDDGSTASASYEVTILNVPPTLGPIIATHDPVALGATVTASAEFTDPGFLDTHTALWDWGEGTTSTGTVTETDGSGTTIGTHAYTEAGVYTVTLTLTDDDGDSDTAVYQYIVVYDPEGGFVTGGGWIMSPEGAYVPDPTLTGKATFGFVSKYKKGANVPTGNTEFVFHAGSLNFHSDSYDWLVVAGTKAKYKGVGTINGLGEYGFMLTAQDGSPDTFRIKIWDKVTDLVVYDNKMGLSADSYDGTALGGGNIVVHKEK